VISRGEQFPLFTKRGSDQSMAVNGDMIEFGTALPE
jgi:hypothetical protein